MRIWLIRHAKSSWADAGQKDFDRPLNKRGNANGPKMQAWLAEQTHKAQWLWTSDAKRALATATFVQAGFGLARDHLEATHELYHASADALLDVIRRTPAEFENVAVVAHNPGLTALVNSLAGHITVNLPTFGVVRLRCDPPWQELQFGQCEKELFCSPKSLQLN